ncbi:DUF1653 domain-containing protein [Candidatus Parcubacteria bacterium]|nr:DUF1653 domain-containing protein [Candidatus Parcubacteria bacterium]
MNNKKSDEELATILVEAGTKVVVGERYAHYKHPECPYRVTMLVILEADQTIGVVYTQDAGKHFPFVRPLKEFLEEVNHEGHLVPRFKKVPLVPPLAHEN